MCHTEKHIAWTAIHAVSYMCCVSDVLDLEVLGTKQFVLIDTGDPFLLPAILVFIGNIKTTLDHNTEVVRRLAWMNTIRCIAGCSNSICRQGL